MKGAGTDKIIEIIKKCPTDALTYEWNDSSKESEKPQQLSDEALSESVEKMTGKPVEIRIMKNGPYVVEGDFSVTGADGVEKKQMVMTSFCRCGASEDMPFCDGSHRIDNFTSSCD